MNLSKRRRKYPDKRDPNRWPDQEKCSVAKVVAHELIHGVSKLIGTSLQLVGVPEFIHCGRGAGDELLRAHPARFVSSNLSLRPGRVQRLPLFPGFREIHGRLL